MKKFIVIEKNLGDKTVYYSFIIDENIDFDAYYHVDPKILKLWVHDKDWVEQNSDIDKVFFNAVYNNFSEIYNWNIDEEEWTKVEVNVDIFKKCGFNGVTWEDLCEKYLKKDN